MLNVKYLAAPPKRGGTCPIEHPPSSVSTEHAVHLLFHCSQREWTPEQTMPGACTGWGDTNALPRAKRVNKHTPQAINNLVKAADKVLPILKAWVQTPGFQNSAPTLTASITAAGSDSHSSTSSLSVLYLGYVHYIALIPSSIITLLPRKPFISLIISLDFYQNGRKRQLATKVSISTQGSRVSRTRAHTSQDPFPLPPQA